jgi:hypothetical protein
MRPRHACESHFHPDNREKKMEKRLVLPNLAEKDFYYQLVPKKHRARKAK